MKIDENWGKFEENSGKSDRNKRKIWGKLLKIVENFDKIAAEYNK